jgi:hypothetical protein
LESFFSREGCGKRSGDFFSSQAMSHHRESRDVNNKQKSKCWMFVFGRILFDLQLQC